MTPTDPHSFFVAGGALSPDTSSYVVRQADTDLLETLRRGEFCYVLDARQMGKSSLMVRTAQHLREEGHTVALLDLTALGQNLTVEQWYDGLLVLLGEQLGREQELEGFWREHSRLGPLQRFMETLRQTFLQATSGHLIIFIDEIDAVRSLSFATDEFFAAIRECLYPPGQGTGIRAADFLSDRCRHPGGSDPGRAHNSV